MGQSGDGGVFSTGVTCFLDSGLVTRLNVVGSHEFLREFDAFTVGVGFCVPPAVLIQGSKGVHQHNLSVVTEGEFFLSIHVNETVLGSFTLNDFIDSEGGLDDGFVFILGDVGDLQGFLPSNVAVELLKFRGHLNIGLGEFHPVLAFTVDTEHF